MYTGFVVMKKNAVVTSKRRGKRSHIIRVTLESSTALLDVFKHLPTWADVFELPRSDSRSELLKTIKKMDYLKQDLSACPSLELTLKEFEIFQRLRLELPKSDVHSFSLTRVVGEYFAGEKKKQVISFLWDFYALNHNSWSRTYDVRSDIKCEEDGLDMSNPALMSALSVLLSSQKEMEQVA